MLTASKIKPALDVQVIGIDQEGNSIAWWTRKDDSWWVSNVRGELGNRDDAGPSWWLFPPKMDLKTRKKA